MNFIPGLFPQMPRPARSLPELSEPRVIALLNIIAKQREALTFYADPRKTPETQVPDFYEELDFGDTARAVLALVEPVEGR